MGVLSAPRGLIVDLVTPLGSDGSLDEQALDRALQRCLPYADAVWLAGPYSSEGPYFPSSQRLAMVKKALSVLHGEVPLWVWVTQDTEEETEETVMTLEEGLKGQPHTSAVTWVDTPLYYHSNRGLPGHYRQLCTALDHPLVLHNDPGLIKQLGKPMKRCNIRTAVLKEVLSTGAVIGMIFHGTLDRSYNYHRASRGLPHFRIYDGDEARFMEYPSMSGVVSLGANLALRAWKEMVRLCLRVEEDLEGDAKSARMAWELRDYLHRLRNLYLPGPPAVIRAVLSDLRVTEASPGDLTRRQVSDLKEQAEALMARHGDFPSP